MNGLVADKSTIAVWLLLLGSAVAYPAVEYFGIYLPLIVPSLPGWSAIPVWVHAATSLPYLALLAAVGFVSRWPGVFVAVLVLGAERFVFVSLMYQYQMPGFLKAEIVEQPAWSLVWVLLQIGFLTGIMAMGLLYRGGVRLRKVAQ